MRDGCILNGDVGSGKSRTGLAYYCKEMHGSLNTFTGMVNPMDLYIITTARKRDTLEWEGELAPFLMSPHQENNGYSNKVVIDSWNNIKKYVGVTGAFFIFDEDRVVGSGAWVKAFLKITKVNRWILLSATPGDTWIDYIPVFVANGFYKNITEFKREHCVYSYYGSYPKLEQYLGVGRLMKYRNDILVSMNSHRDTTPHHETIVCTYDMTQYRSICKDHWDPFKDEPIDNAAQFCYCLRECVNRDPSRLEKVIDILCERHKAIIFYNYDYELEILRELHDCGSFGKFEVAEWNGHKHMDIPDGEAWVYLVQYNAGSEGWNCIKTDTIIFYSNNYSYKMMRQAAGRIDRMNTPFKDLYYYHLQSRSGIDLAINKALGEKKKFNENRFYERS
jgi:hypothetical protein